jgi:putative serine/threonine protein kinase
LHILNLEYKGKIVAYRIEVCLLLLKWETKYIIPKHIHLLSGSLSLKSPQIIPLDNLVQEPYASIICFPKPDETDISTRIDELRNLNVYAIEFSGRSSVFGVPLPVLGKGFVGVVVVAHQNSNRLALKIRRTDADRVDLFHEAKMLSKANGAKVGPKLVGISKNFLLMELIEGELLPNWLNIERQQKEVKDILGQILKQCFQLDRIGLDHGELSKAPKHVIVDHQGKPWIVDFETASDSRKPANVSAICHFLFNSPGEVAQKVAAFTGQKNTESIIVALRDYKKSLTEESLDAVIQTCLG